MAGNSMERRLKFIQEALLVMLASCFLTAAVDTTHTDCSKVPSFNRPGCTCHCRHTQNGCTSPVAISCMNAKFNGSTIKEAFSNLPASVEHLNVQGDNIPELPPNIFGHHPLIGSKLQVLNMANNHIRLIHGKTFHGVHNITKLILDNNDWDVRQKVRVFSNFDKLEILSLNNAFNDKTDGSMHAMQLNYVFLSSELPNLRELNLANNSLTNGTLGVLHYLKSIQKVNLAFNDFTYVHLPRVWMKKIEHIDLTHNQISALSDHTTEALVEESKERAIQLHLGYNPYHCNCSEIHFLQWLNTTPLVADKDEMHCALPANLKGRVLISVKVSDIGNCPNSALDFVQKGGNSRGSVIAVAVVVSLLCLLFAAVMYMNRAKLKRKTRNFTQSVTMALGLHSHRGYSNVEPTVSTI